MRKQRHSEIKHLAAGYSSGKQRIRVQIQSSDFGGSAVLHQAMQACCLGDPQCTIDSLGLCKQEADAHNRKRLPAWGSQPDCTCPCWTLHPLLPSALLPTGPLQSCLPNHWWRETCFNQVLPAISRPALGEWGVGGVGGFLAKTLESFQAFTPPPPGKELK